MPTGDPQGLIPMLSVEASAKIAVAAGLREEGVSVSVYDVRHEVPELRAAAEGLGVHWVASPAELAGRCAAIVALTSAKVAVLGARAGPRCWWRAGPPRPAAERPRRLPVRRR